MNLKTYLQLGLKLTKIRRILAFTQSRFIKEYIDICTELRRQSKTPFAKNLWKLFANAVFGKFIENCRSYLTVVLCTNAKSVVNRISSPRYQSMKIISEDLVAVFLKTVNVKLNKPLQVGFTILERSKEFMCNQFYNVIRPALGDNVEVMMSDTDSFLLCIRSNEKDTDPMNKLNHILDRSNYPKNDARYDEKYANQLGKWKNETPGGTITEYAGLRSKTYSYKLVKDCQYDDENNTEITYNKCKGVTRGYKKTIVFEDFKECIDKVHRKKVQQFNIRAKNHIIYTLESTKICFSSFDDKRYLFNCAIHSTPYGSSLIVEAEKNGGICPLCS